MKTALRCDGNILVVGDGDFSFTVSLMKHFDFKPDYVYTSNLETHDSILRHVQASENMTSLKELGVSVFLETDARDLHNHPVLGKQRFDRIVFNFPLADRHNIKKNRALLADFFSSCRSVLTSDGQVLVTLCRGQGGTPADQPMRSWHDSWQVVAMSTNASFLLREVLPFDPVDFPEYHSVGFRFQDKSFNVAGALTHVFEQGILIEDSDVTLRGTVHHEGVSYSCSSYVAEGLKRNLLNEHRNPLFMLKQNVEAKLSDDPTTSVIFSDGCSSIIPSRTSRASFHTGEEIVSIINSPQNDTENEGKGKDWKNSENMRRLNKAQLAHGVADGNEISGTLKTDKFDSIDITLLPDKSEDVYILVKTKDSITQKTCIDTVQREGMNATCSMEDDACLNIKSSNSITEEKSNSGVDGADSSPPIICHCRSSLLEDLPSHCETLTEKVLMLQADQRQNVTTPCLVTSGQCFVPCPISLNLTPVKYEMLVIHLVTLDLCTESESSQSVSQCQFDSISSKMLSIVNSFLSHHSTSSTPFSISKCSTNKIDIEGVDEACLIESINTSSAKESSSESLCSILSSKIGNCLFHVTVINLQRLVCCLCGVNDPRLLSSTNEKFLNQFQTDLSVCRYHPFSLYPMKFVHDLSFWERSDSSDQFNAAGFYEAIRNVAGDVVVDVGLMDVYEDTDSNGKSRCYRLYFQSSDKCLPYVTSWKIQSQIRTEVARSLGIRLR